MAQQQKQRERSAEVRPLVGITLIAGLDVLLGLPLTALLVLMFRFSNLSGKLIDAPWTVIPWILMGIGFLPAGVFLFLRQYRLAQAFQWLSFLGGLSLGAAALYTAIRYPQSPTDLALAVGGFGLGLFILLALPLWLKKLTED